MSEQRRDIASLTRLIETGVRDRLRHVVFEPNGPALWGKISDEIDAFLQTLFVEGVLKGDAADEAFFVKIDTETQSDIDQGILNVMIGFAPLKPAEFVVITIGQMAQSADGGPGCKS